MKASNFILCLGTIDGESPFSLLNEIYNTQVFTEDELRSQVVDKLNAIQESKTTSFELCQAPPHTFRKRSTLGPELY